MIKTKNIIFIFLIFGIFLIAACQNEDVVGRRIRNIRTTTTIPVISGGGSGGGSIGEGGIGTSVSDCRIENSEGVDLSSDSGITGLTNANTLHLQPKNQNNQITLTKTDINGRTSTIYTKEAWIYYAGVFDAKCGGGGSKGPICVGVFYKNKNNANKKTLFAELKYSDALSIRC